jgi:predicted dienelactone hydrolase
MKLHILLCCLVLGCASLCAAAQESLSIAGLKVAVWDSAGTPDARQPVVIFSHGFHGCATQSRFLMSAIAAAGYVVLAPNHRDATCGGGQARLTARPDVPFTQPQSWDESTYRDRAEDIRLLIAALHTDRRFADHLDWSRLALAGHSLGGYTVLGLSGAWPSWKLPEVRAVLALSPYVQPFLAKGTLGGLTVPVMYQGGTNDWGITPWLARLSGAYAKSPAPKYFIEFKGATHFAWTNLGRLDRPAITAYSVAFLDYHDLGRRNAAATLLRQDPEVERLQFSSDLGQRD